ncbi:hypothetical protein SKAU_G00025520 [Synaphobranchus kaupii]|uniref:Uncharacterized protein n=1 Tax=Synaphobranchus kaupii TaxID=118154 RepID=A0A9Q1GE08_SYNKA|nr:hypothetical protein SKAU_G00025520 [Synaphobranchus kaupii]
MRLKVEVDVSSPPMGSANPELPMARVSPHPRPPRAGRGARPSVSASRSRDPWPAGNRGNPGALAVLLQPVSSDESLCLEIGDRARGVALWWNLRMAR